MWAQRAQESLLLTSRADIDAENAEWVVEEELAKIDAVMTDVTIC